MASPPAVGFSLPPPKCINTVISVIILNINKPVDTINCLKSLYKNTHRDFSVVLVDNGSTDGSVERIRSEFLFPSPRRSRSRCFATSEVFARDELKIIETGENLGFNGGVNVG